MKMKARCWVESVEFWPAYWEQLEAVKKELDSAGIKIPIPKHEISRTIDSRELMKTEAN